MNSFKFELSGGASFLKMHSPSSVSNVKSSSSIALILNSIVLHINIYISIVLYFQLGLGFWKSMTEAEDHSS